MHEHTVSNYVWGFFDWVCYFIYGNGLWSNSWVCSGEDIAALGFKTVACLLMAWQYWVQVKQSRLFEDGLPWEIVEHSRRTRTFFLFCIYIHLVAAIATIIIPLHYVVGVLFLVNAWQCHALNISNARRLLFDRMRQGEEALENQAKTVIDLRTAEVIMNNAQQSSDAMHEAADTVASLRRLMSATREQLEKVTMECGVKDA